MWKKPCYYCGTDIKTIGIDRINSDGSYSTATNGVVPCCRFCNAGKMNHSVSKFADLIERIYLSLVSF